MSRDKNDRWQYCVVLYGQCHASGTNSSRSVLLNECWLLDISHFLIEDKSLFQMKMSTTDNIENCNGRLTVDFLRTIHVYDTITSTLSTYLSCIKRCSLCYVRGHALKEFIATTMRKEIYVLFRLLN
jgi:hypothetical protein